MEALSILPYVGIVLGLLFKLPFLFLDIPSWEILAVLIMKTSVIYKL